MRKFLAIFSALILLFQVVQLHNKHHPLVTSRVPPQATSKFFSKTQNVCEPQVTAKVSQPRASENVLKNDVGAVRVEYLTQEDDDDITTLLEPEQFQDFDIPIVFNDAVKYYIHWFSTEKRKSFLIGSKGHGTTYQSLEKY